MNENTENGTAWYSGRGVPYIYKVYCLFSTQPCGFLNAATRGQNDATREENFLIPYPILLVLERLHLWLVRSTREKSMDHLALTFASLLRDRIL